MLRNLYVTGLKLSRDIPGGNYLNALPVVRHLKNTGELPIRKKVTFFVGENGVGKSTLLEAMAVALGFNPEGGTVNFNFSTEDTHSELYKYLTVCKGVDRYRDGFFLRAESFYNVATAVDRLGVGASYGGSLHHRSHGESFLALVENRFGGDGLYLLDEPEAALSPSRLLELMGRMDDLVRRRSQFIVCTHSPILMAFPDSEVYLLSDDGIRSVPYRETEHFIVTKEFLNNPERMLRYALKNDN